MLGIDLFKSRYGAAAKTHRVNHVGVTRVRIRHGSSGNRGLLRRAAVFLHQDFCQYGEDRQ